MIVRKICEHTLQFERIERNIFLLFFAEMYLAVAFLYYIKNLRKFVYIYPLVLDRVIKINHIHYFSAAPGA